jgi:hypothetical protein
MSSFMVETGRKEIPWAPGYRADNDGSIWSRQSSSPLGTLRDDWHQLKQKRTTGGYLSVTLYVRGQAHHRYVHRLILETFVGPCPYGMECRHLDGNPLNNVLSNLKWDTRANNVADKILHGTKVEGSRVKNAVTNEREVKAIKRLLQFGIQHRIIAYSFGLKTHVVNGISSGKAWNHVSLEDSDD